ncbi:MAG TPA: GAF domain-containing sensor histidine kinase [Acidimicrobiales bacterium]|nr:GAF domain-containing sensor histidine kinase [Acidimicrobiales bacterium]
MALGGDGTSELERLQRWLQASVELVRADQVSSVLQCTVEAACALTGASTATLNPLVAGLAGSTMSAGRPTAAAGAEPAALCVPLVVDGEPVATLLLAGPTDGASFAPGDDELVAALATLAGTAIARLTVQRENRRERWVTLLNEISSALMAGSHSDDVLALAAEGARELAEADVAAVCVGLPSSRQFEVRAADGSGSERLIGARFDTAGTVFEAVMGDEDALVLDGGVVADHRREPLVRAGVSGPALFVPLVIEGRRVAMLAAGRVAGRPPFNDSDSWLVESFASQVSVALEYGVAQVKLKQVAVTADQERIARDLHDTVIQQLFAIGMSLQTLAKSSPDSSVVERVQHAVDGLDVTIRDIRATVSALQRPPHEGTGLRSEVRLLVEELSRVYGLASHVRFHGMLDIAVPEAIALHLLAIVREALSNVGRHARANIVDVDVEIATAVVVRVADDGIGIPDQVERRSGLRNLEDRAAVLGGTLRISRLPAGGTALIWRVPLTTPDTHRGWEVTGEHAGRIVVADGRSAVLPSWSEHSNDLWSEPASRVE